MAFKLHGDKKWTAIVLTCQSISVSHVIQQEIKARQTKGLIDKDVLILTVEDPKARVGSGGATLNALYLVAEHLGATLDHTIVTAEILQNTHILIMHMGRDFPFDTCGRAFTSLPLIHRESHDTDFVFTNFDMLLSTVSNSLGVNSPPGVWVCSTDMLLSAPVAISNDKFLDTDLCIIATSASLKYASHHGALKIGEHGYVSDIIFRGKYDVLSEQIGNENIPIICGAVFISYALTEKLLSLTIIPPLDACTYIGLDNGAQPIELSIFFDIALAMCESIEEEAFVTGKRSGIYGTEEKLKGTKGQLMKQARSLLWRNLHGAYKVKATVAEEGQHCYMDSVASTHHNSLLTGTVLQNSAELWRWKSVIHSQVPEDAVPDQATIINSIIESNVHIAPKSVIKNCHVPSGTKTGKDSFLSNLQKQDFANLENSELPQSMFTQAFRIQIPILGKVMKMKVLVVFGKFDNVMAPMWKGASTYCNNPWVLFLSGTGITKEDLWAPHIPEDDMNLMTAKLFPVAHTTSTPCLADILWVTQIDEVDESRVEKWRASWRLSFSEILSLVDIEHEFVWRKDIFYAVGESKMRDILLGEKSQGLSQFYRNAVVDGYAEKILDVLDVIASTCESPGIAARTLANIADVLGHMAFGKGGMRSGPAANQQWKSAFNMLEMGNIREGAKAMAMERKNWMSRPGNLVRAARHYEGGAQILIRHAVITARTFIDTKEGKPIDMGRWVVAECPARLDLSGGWSDTPPVTYEHGGAVTTLGIRVDGKKPIGAKVRRIPEKHLLLHLGSGATKTVLTVQNYNDLSDYNQPHAPGALLKAAFYCADVVKFDAKVTLEEQLESKYNGGFEMVVWSDLPHGSGLGTSSILAGAILAALWTAVGKQFQLSDLVHAVLHLEQMLTTGGGWQDQVGGLVGGLALSVSKPSLPLFVQFRRLKVPDTVVSSFNKKMVLIYTGKTRLARDLLQNVLRQWYARLPGIVRTEDNLVINAHDCARALEIGDLESVGKCFDLYWEQKKLMAPGCEPVVVAEMRKALQPYTLGMCMAGAGGGGFLYILLKEESSSEMLRDILNTVPGGQHLSIHMLDVDMDGLTVRYEDGAGDR